MTARALAIGGSDPSGAAGVQQDLRTFAAFGVWGASAITSITAQNTSATFARHDVAAEVVREQIDAVLTDIVVDAVKIGMLPNAGVVAVVADALDRYEIANAVLDPVLVSTSGHALADDDVVDAIRTQLLPRVALMTPNAHEASVLSGIEIVDGGTQTRAARALVDLGARAVVVTGGHVPLQGALVNDRFVDAAATPFAGAQGRRQDVGPIRGAGGVYSAAICAGLANGQTLQEAIAAAFMLVQDLIKRGVRPGAGALVLDPMAGGPGRGKPVEAGRGEDAG